MPKTRFFWVPRGGEKTFIFCFMRAIRGSIAPNYKPGFLAKNLGLYARFRPETQFLYPQSTIPNPESQIFNLQSIIPNCKISNLKSKI
jgi:hypothetical protein